MLKIYAFFLKIAQKPYSLGSNLYQYSSYKRVPPLPRHELPWLSFLTREHARHELSWVVGKCVPRWAVNFMQMRYARGRGLLLKLLSIFN